MRPLRTAGVLCACAAAATLTACGATGSNAAQPTARPTRAGAPVTSSPASPTASAEDGCARLVSAIAYAEFALAPEGQEQDQDFDRVVRGRLAYVEGTVLAYEDAIPAGVLPVARRMARAAAGTDEPEASQARRVAALRAYRTAAAEVERLCGP